MNKSLKKNIKMYLKEIKRVLPSSSCTKTSFYSVFKNRIYEYAEDNPSSTTFTRSGTKTVENRSDDDELLWQYKLTGTFTVVEGVSATCTNATYTQTINDGYWHFSDGNAYAENNVAHGLGTFKKKVLFITLKTYNIDISVTCDAYGNLS